MLAEDSSLQSSFSDVQFKKLKAGSVEIENFRGSSVQQKTAFPKQIMDFVNVFLDNGGSAYYPLGFGLTRDSDFDDDFGFNLGM
jgi:hypothetical protein